MIDIKQSAETIENAIYIVPTPIGNFADITLRALTILKNVDIIAVEDTRVTGKLLAYYGIKASMIVYNDLSTSKTRNKILQQLSEGKSVALVSDAGTPLISDPGYKLIKSVYEQNHKVISLPGASSVLVALTISGLPSDRFLFAGFLPHKSTAVINCFTEFSKLDATCIFFDAARRLTKTLKIMAQVLTYHEVVVLREITKHFEERKYGTAEELYEYYMANPPKGEVIILTHPSKTKADLSEDELKAKLKKYLKTMSVKEAAKLLSDETGLKKSDLYNLAHSMA